MYLQNQSKVNLGLEFWFDKQVLVAQIRTRLTEFFKDQNLMREIKRVCFTFKLALIKKALK